MEIFTIIFTQPITNLLVACYGFLTMLHVPYAFAFSIILLTGVIRIILLPFTASQIRATKKMHLVNPHLKLIREKHKDDKKKQQEEIMKLYKEYGINPISGCLPVIIQLPIIWALYHVLINAVNINSAEKLAEINSLMYFPGIKVNGLWDPTFFGISLAQSPASMFTAAPLIILVPVITGVFQFILSKMMMPEKPIQSEKGKSEDFQTTFAKQSLFIFPILIGVMSFNLPFGLSIYWNAFTIFGIIQQYFQAGPGGLVQYKGLITKYAGRK